MVALITFPGDEAARSFARRLVEGQLAACVNVVPGVTSVYAWEGKVHEDSECLAICKTTRAQLAAIETALEDHHPYDTPEFVVLRPEHVEARYLAWLRGATGRQ